MSLPSAHLDGKATARPLGSPLHDGGAATVSAPSGWSYTTPVEAGPRRISRRTILIAVAVVVVLIAGLLTWLLWPKSAPKDQGEVVTTQKPLLNDKPPTVILNGLQRRSLRLHPRLRLLRPVEEHGVGLRIRPGP